MKLDRSATEYRIGAACLTDLILLGLAHEQFHGAIAVGRVIEVRNAR